MRTRCILFFIFCLLSVRLAIAGERPRVAVPRFRNSTVRISGTDMAAWMANELKKTKKFEPNDLTDVNAITKDAKWDGTRFDRDVESRLREMLTDYVLYGSLQTYRIENFILNNLWRLDEPQVPQIILEFSILMVDLRRNSPDQEVLVKGDAIADPTQGFGPPPYEENDSALDTVFQKASRQAMGKAAKNFAEYLQ